MSSDSDSFSEASEDSFSETFEDEENEMEDSDSDDEIRAKCTSSRDLDNCPTYIRQWRVCKDPKATIQLQYVEKYLLNVAKKESKGVLANVRAHLNLPPSSKMTAGQLFKAFLPPQLISKLLQLFGSRADMTKWIQQHLYMMAYKISVEKLYDIEFEAFSQYRLLPESKFRKFNAMLTDRPGQWPELFAQSENMQEIQKYTMEHHAKLVHIKGTTLLTIDDDKLVGRGLSNELRGFRLKKITSNFGPVFHAIGSSVTSLILGGVIEQRGDTILGIVKTIIFSVFNVNVEERLIGLVKNHAIKIAMDRGYMTEDVVIWLTQMGFQVLGTCPRTGINHNVFHFSKNNDRHKPSKEQIEIPVKGTLMMAHAQKVLKTHDGTAKKLNCLVSRDGLGKVTLFLTSWEDIAPDCFDCDLSPSPRAAPDLTPKPGDDDDSEESDDSEEHEESDEETAQKIFKHIESEVKVLTDTQRTLIWFILRKFRITSSIANTILSFLYKTSYDEYPIVYELLSFPSLEENQSNDIACEALKNELKNLTCKELKQRCRDRNLGVTGNKETLATRIAQHTYSDELVDPHEASLHDPDTSYVDGLVMKHVANWCMAPLTRRSKVHDSLRIGQENESNIRKAFPEFYHRHSKARVVTTEEWGLVAHANHHRIATSVDGIAIMKVEVENARPPSNWRYYPQLLELKTRTTRAPLDKESDLKFKYGEFNSIIFPEETEGEAMSVVAKRFKALVPHRKERVQLLHHW